MSHILSQVVAKKRRGSMIIPSPSRCFSIADLDDGCAVENMELLITRSSKGADNSDKKPRSIPLANIVSIFPPNASLPNRLVITLRKDGRERAKTYDFEAEHDQLTIRNISAPKTEKVFLLLPEQRPHPSKTWRFAWFLFALRGG